MYTPENLNKNYFSPSEIELLREGSDLPGISVSLDNLLFKRTADNILEQVCNLAFVQQVIAHSYGESCGFEDVEIASVDSRKKQDQLWNIHVDVVVPCNKDGGRVAFPISNPFDILGVEICWEPNAVNDGDLDDFGFEAHQIVRNVSGYWVARPNGTTPLTEVTEMLALLDKQINS